jgi:hypothetical protein
MLQVGATGIDILHYSIFFFFLLFFFLLLFFYGSAVLVGLGRFSVP